MRQEIYVCDICGSEIGEEEYAEYNQGDQLGIPILNKTIQIKPYRGKHICDKCINEINEAIIRAMLVKTGG